MRDALSIYLGRYKDTTNDLIIDIYLEKDIIIFLDSQLQVKPTNLNFKFTGFLKIKFLAKIILNKHL